MGICASKFGLTSKNAGAHGHNRPEKSASQAPTASGQQAAKPERKCTAYTDSEMYRYPYIKPDKLPRFGMLGAAAAGVATGALANELLNNRDKKHGHSKPESHGGDAGAHESHYYGHHDDYDGDHDDYDYDRDDYDYDRDDFDDDFDDYGDLDGDGYPDEGYDEYGYHDADYDDMDDDGNW